MIGIKWRVLISAHYLALRKSCKTKEIRCECDEGCQIWQERNPDDDEQHDHKLVNIVTDTRNSGDRFVTLSKWHEVYNPDMLLVGCRLFVWARRSRA